MLGCKRVKRGRQWPDRKRPAHQGSVVGRLIGANPRLNFIPGLFNSFANPRLNFIPGLFNSLVQKPVWDKFLYFL